MKRSIIVQKRREAKKLRLQGWSIRKIARYLVCSPASVSRWLGLSGDQLETDRRGWNRGRQRKYGDEEKKRVIAVLGELAPMKAGAVKTRDVRSRYREQYSADVSDWFVKQTLKAYRASPAVAEEAQLMDQYTLSASRLLRKIGGVVMRVNFWRLKDRSRSGEDIYCLFCEYIHPHKFGILHRVAALSSEEVIRVLKLIWFDYMTPDVVAMNNHAAFGTHLTVPGHLGRVPLFLLNVGIKPLYQALKKKVIRTDQDPRQVIFSSPFFDRLCSELGEVKGLDIIHFQLEYREKSTCPVKTKTLNPLFMKAFTNSELENRHLKGFLEQQVFFYG